MAKHRNNGMKKNGIVKLKAVVEKLQKSLLLSGKKLESYNDEYEEVLHDSNYYVRDDVKEGHFAVIAEENKEMKRFVVPLSYLNDPSFLMLLDQATDVYGFNHGGALTIPCRPSELEIILANNGWRDKRY